MRFHMTSEMAGLRESPMTLVADVRLGALVDSHMNAKFVRRREGLDAENAVIWWSLSRMNSFMDAKILTRAESLSALVAFVRHFAGMDPLVPAKMFLDGKCL